MLREPLDLDTLALGYSATGDTARAIEMQTKALDQLPIRHTRYVLSVTCGNVAVSCGGR